MSTRDAGYKKSAIKNTISSVVMQLVVMMIGLVLPKLYIITYGSEVNGLVTSISQFISYFTIVEAGLSSAGINALYRPLAEGDTKKVSGVLSAIKKFYFQVGYIFSGLLFGLAFLYPLFVSLEGFSYGDIVVLVLVLGLNGVIDFFTLSKYRALLTADQKYSVVANATTVAYIVNFFGVYAAMKAGLEITIVRFLALSLYIVRSLIVNIYVKTKYKNIDKDQAPDCIALHKRWDAMILQLLGLAQTSMPVVILTVFSDNLSDVSVYAIYNMVASNILSVMFTVTNGASAPFGDVIANNDKGKLKSMYKAYESGFLALTAIVYSCVLVMYIPFIRIYTSGVTDYKYIYPLTAVLFTLNGVAYNLKTPAGTLIGSAGVFKETKSATIIQTVIAIVGCIILTPIWGINGLLVGLILSNIYRDIDLVIYMDKHVIGIPPISSFKKMILCLSSCAIVGFGSLLFRPEPSGYAMWLVEAVIVLVASIGVVILVHVIFDRKEVLTGIRYLKRMIIRR